MAAMLAKSPRCAGLFAQTRFMAAGYAVQWNSDTVCAIEAPAEAPMALAVMLLPTPPWIVLPVPPNPVPTIVIEAAVVPPALLMAWIGPAVTELTGKVFSAARVPAGPLLKSTTWLMLARLAAPVADAPMLPPTLRR